jgi:uncharacterized membrane protein
MFKDLLAHNYITRGFWGDEAWTAVISRLSIPEIVQVTSQDFHPPLYYLLVHWFMQIFGESEWIRMLSLVFFLVTLPVIYYLVKKFINRQAAWISTLLVAFSPILFVYAFEARSYGLLTLLSVSTTWIFWQALTGSKTKGKAVTARKMKFWLAYGLVGSLGIYTHYYMWFILAAHGFFWLLADRRQFKQVFLVYLFILLTQLPWLSTLFSQVKTVAGDYWIGAINERTHAEYFLRIAAGDITTAWQTNLARAIFIVLILSPLVVWWKHKRRFPPGYLFLWSWLLVPILLPTLISLIYRPVFFYRYLVFTSVPILLITVWGLASLKKELLYVLAGLLLIFYLKTDYLIFSRAPRSMREELAAAFASPQPPSSEVPVFTYLPSFAEVYFYTGQQAPVKVVPLGLVQFSGRSLLDKYEKKGLVEIVEPDPTQSYWEFDQGPTTKFHAN